MKKSIYIIPGLNETTRRKPYQILRATAEAKGYEVIFKNVDWSKPLSEQIFAVSENAVVFGFSLGAILAWLVAQKNSCSHVILASMTPHYSFTDPKIKDALIELVGEEFVEDIIKYLKKTNRAKTQTIIYGDLEEEKADILVPNTQHELNRAYIKVIGNIL